MADDLTFIDGLPIPDDKRRRLRELGVASPLALMSLIVASRDAFAGWIGPRETQDVIRAIEPRLSAAERAELGATPTRFATGAALGPLPDASSPAMDDGDRERLFEQIESLRREPQGERRHREEIATLERRIAAMY